MRLRTILFLCFLLSYGAIASAGERPKYVGFVFEDAQFDPEVGSTVDGTNLNFKLGYAFSKFWGVEAHAGKNLSSKENFGGNSVAYVAGLLRGNIPLQRINIYGLIGLAGVRADFGSNFDDSFTGLATGVGIEFFGTENTALMAEFVQYGTDDVYQTIGIGLVHHFDWPELR